jgi:hypothetical protein
MKTTIKSLVASLALLFVALGMAGCAFHPVRKFEASPHVQTFEKWRLYVNVLADNPTRHQYNVNCLAWTLPGDFTNGDPKAFRKSAYTVTLQSLTLHYLNGARTVEIPLNRLHPEKSNDPTRLAVLIQEGLVDIPPQVRQLEATMTALFTNTASGQAETKVFKFKMTKREGKEIGPLLR